MLNIREIEMIKIAEKEIERFAIEWKKTPYAWETETDVHAELYMRIKLSLHKKKFQLGKYNAYSDLIDEEKVDWIYCKPKTYLNKKAYYPDIVIYKDMGTKYRIKGRENDPMLWACEIKYITDWSSQLSKEGVQNDIAKLRGLLNRKRGGADRVCYLILQRRKKREGESGYVSVLHYGLQLSRNNKISEILKNLEKKNKKLKLYCYSVNYKKIRQNF